MVGGIIVDKLAHRIQLFSHSHILRSWAGAEWSPSSRRATIGCPRALIASPVAMRTAFYQPLRIGCPRADQQIAAQKRGVDPGGVVMIHGIRKGLGWLGPWQRKLDWPRGCVAVTDREIEDVWAVVPDGTPVFIRP
jgi:hypothetical protein